MTTGTNRTPEAERLAGLRVVPDESAERRDQGRIIVGGSPTRLLRLSDAGAGLVERLWRGEPLPEGPGATALVRRLLDAGLVHPDWSSPGAPRTEDAPFRPTDVTVVIPVRGTLAPRLLQSIGAVAAVVVVDDASPEPVVVADRTPQGRPVLLLRHQAQRGPGGARTSGMAEVTTALVAFLDADCEPEPGWLDALLPHFADAGLAAVAPRITSADLDRPGIVGRYESACSALDMGARPARVRARSRVGHVPCAALVARVDAIRDVGGFDPSLLVGEDVDLVWRLDAAGWAVRYEPAARVAHHHRTSPWAWARRRADYGTAAGMLARRHPGLLSPVELPRRGRADREGALVAAGADARRASQLVAAGDRSRHRQLIRCLVRPWWPLAVVAVAMVPTRAGKAAVGTALIGAVTGSALRDWAVERPPVGPATFVVGRLADDVAYSVGVWHGSLRAHTTEPLRPRWAGTAT